MIMDQNLLVSGVTANGALSGQSIVGTGNILSTNTIDLLQNRDLGGGDTADFFGRFELTTAVAGATSVEFQIVTADDAALGTNLNVIGSSGAIPVAQLTLGARFVVALNPKLGASFPKGQRYLGARYVVTGTSTTGAVMGDFGAEYSDGVGKVYPSGFSVA